jgi:alpha-ribazole phosphatase/probable phosphoglycerate mutase
VTTIVLIRHGHTASNGGADARLSGLTDVPLSPRGREEVRCLQRSLRGTVPFDAIYSSPLRRAWHTAIALEAVGLGPLWPCAALREIDCGTLDGMPLPVLQRRFPQLWAANLRQDDETFRWPGGESYREFRCRSLRAVRRFALHHRGSRIAVVTHAGVISQIIGSMMGLSSAKWEPLRPANAALSEIEWGHGTARVTRFDERAHLTTAGG